MTSHAAPFYVTIPMPDDSESTGFNYAVNAYPKNQDTPPPTKTITDPQNPAKGLGHKVGDVVEWTITQTIPALESQKDLYIGATLYDVLPSSLAYASTEKVTLKGADLTANATTGYVLDDGVVSWSLGTEVLEGLKAGDVFTVTFRTTVLEVTESGGIENGPGESTIEQPGYGFKYNGKTVPGEPTPATFWGELIIKKVDQDGGALAGATFEVYPAAAEAPFCAAAAPSDKAGLIATGESQDTTGLVLWDNDFGTTAASTALGLWVKNFQNKTYEPLEARNYCVYETVIPAGYVVDTTAHTVPVAAGKTVEAGWTTITNTKPEGPTLPLTGASGTALLIAGGLGLVAIAFGAHMVIRNRQKRDA